MKVSVVIPTYNEEKYIEECLKHVSSQTHKPTEIIIVDNNCTDNTIQIAKKFPVKIIREPLQGMIPARNTGYSAAVGDIILRTDADSKVPPTWVETVVSGLSKQKIDAITGPVTFYDMPLQGFSRFLTNTYQLVATFLYRHPVLVGPNCALTRQMWLQIRDTVCVHDKDVHEDIDLAIHIAKAGGKISNDFTIVVPVSARRIKKRPWSFFGEYTVRFVKTWLRHL